MGIIWAEEQVVRELEHPTIHTQINELQRIMKQLQEVLAGVSNGNAANNLIWVNSYIFQEQFR
jgi:hypothetical protein